MTFLLLWMQSCPLRLVEVYVVFVFIYLEMGAISVSPYNPHFKLRFGLVVV